MTRRWNHPSVTAEERRHFLEDVLAPENLQRIFWFILAFLPVSILVCVENWSAVHSESITPWSYFDLALTFPFLFSVVYARRKGAAVRWKHRFVLFYSFYVLVSMGGYYFGALPSVGENASYILGLLMVGVLFRLPPSQFFPLLLANHAVFLALVFHSSRSFNEKLTSAVGGTDGLIVACLAAWFLFSKEWENFRKEAVIAENNRELLETNERLRRVNEEMNEVMAIAAHDLRSPLCTAQGLYEILREEEAWRKEPYAGALAEFGKISEGMLALVGRLLDAHAAEHRGGEIPLQRVEIAGLAARSMEKMRRPAEAKAIRLQTEFGERPEIETDPQAVEQALDNLLSNAVKFSPHGASVTVAAGREANGCWVEVRDEGPGIPEEDRAQLFRKFYRGRNLPTGSEPSTGLGLFIVRQLTESVGGSVAYRPRMGPGAVFRLTFPCAASL